MAKSPQENMHISTGSKGPKIVIKSNDLIAKSTGSLQKNKVSKFKDDRTKEIIS